MNHRCSYCSAWTETRAELDQHIIAMHSTARPGDPLVRIAVALERLVEVQTPVEYEVVTQGTLGDIGVVGERATEDLRILRRKGKL